MEQVRWVRDREPVEAWVEAAVVKAGDRVARAEEEVVKAEEVAARGEVVALRQVQAVTAYAPSVVKERLINSDTHAMSNSVPSAERP
jgi:hypothetical protein